MQGARAHLAGHGFTEEAEAGGCNHLASAYLHVSNTCNLSCVGCYSADCNRNRAVDPSLDDLCHAIDVLACLGVTRLVISGGEPFLREDLPEIAQHAREQGMTSITVLTNGTHCGDEMLAKLVGNVDVWFLSPSTARAGCPCAHQGRAAVRGACRHR